jgi:hypothetical protein
VQSTVLFCWLSEDARRMPADSKAAPEERLAAQNSIGAFQVEEFPPSLALL